MTVYERNLKTLAMHYPGMDDMIKKAEKELKPELEVIQETSYEGELILKIKKDDRILYLNGKRDTEKSAQMWVDTIGKLQNMAPVLMMGIGNPSYLKRLIEQTENRITIVIYEPSYQIFLKFLEMVELERWMEKHLIVFWVEGLQDMQLSRMRGLLGKILKYEMLVYIRCIILPNYDVLFEEKAVEFVRLCRDIALQEMLAFNTKNHFSPITVKNLFANAKYLLDGYKTTQLPAIIPKGCPGILVAAGPSLNKNIHELKKAKGKAFIAAVDTAIRPLLQAGIVPDLFAIVDAEKPLELVQEEGAKDIPLMTTLNAAPKVLKYHTGMKFFWDEGYQFAEEIFLKSGQRMGDVCSGGSVATNIFSLLHKIGIETIILVGQDLAYTNNKSHADGTFHDTMEEHDTSNFVMVEGNYEDKVPTKTDLKNFINWYNMYIEGCKNNDENFRVINATEGGAKIRNTEIMTLKEAIEQECTKEIDIQERLRNLSPMLGEEERKWTIGYLRGLSEKFIKLKSDAGKLKKLYEKLDKICNRKNIDQKEYLNLLKKVKTVSTKMEESSSYQLVAITLNNAQYIMGNEQFLVEDTIQKEGKEIARKGILYTKNVIEMAELFREMAEDAFADLV